MLSEWAVCSFHCRVGAVKYNESVSVPHCCTNLQQLELQNINSIFIVYSSEAVTLGNYPMYFYKCSSHRSYCSGTTETRSSVKKTKNKKNKINVQRVYRPCEPYI